MDFKSALEKIISSLTEKFKYNSLIRYRISSDTGSKIDANSVIKTDGHPDIQGAERVHGVPGFYSTLQSNQQVLIAYEGGDPARPYVVGFFAGVPVKLEVRVLDEMEIKKNLNPTSTIFIALSDPTIARLEALNNIVQSLNTWIQIASTIIKPLLPPPAQAGFQTLMELIDSQAQTADTSVSTADQNYPIGIKSTAVKAN